MALAALLSRLNRGSLHWSSHSDRRAQFSVVFMYLSGISGLTQEGETRGCPHEAA